MKKDKTLWTREYKLTGRFIWGHGAYAIRKYVSYARDRCPRHYYAISISPCRRSWHKRFWTFDEAAKFARNLVKRRRNE